MGVAGAGILPSVTAAYLCMPRRYAFNICLGGAAAGVSIVTGLSALNMLFLLIMALSASMGGYYALHRIESREHLGYKLFLLAVFLACMEIALRGIGGIPVTWESLSLRWPVGETWRILLQFLTFDLAVSFFVVTFLPMIENSIGALSVLKIRELSHPSSPLLRKLQAETPGTYHHSLMIGTLAEAAASELGMDENLMKAGAYYHDIGKLFRPRFFVENQLGGVNIHDTISPTLSAAAILSHVRDGLALANEYGLPKKVKQFITEHHGTTSIGYFYKKARALGENVDIEQFCYPGPKPQSRETALLMLLDSLEAAMRAESGNITAVSDIQEIIDRVVAVKIADKQLDDVDFTFSDITRVKKAALKAFQSMYHTRTVKEIKQ
jgi:putative nucleotidyltransferase with HDIG domain